MNKTRRFHYFIWIMINLYFPLFARVTGNCELLSAERLFKCSFTGDPEDHIRNTIIDLKSPVKYLWISSSFVTNITFILTGINLGQLEKLTVMNAHTAKTDLSVFDMPMLKILELTDNEMNLFAFPKSHSIQYLNLSNNNLEKWILISGNLETLDLSHNNFNDFKMEDNYIKFLNLSRSFSGNSSFVRNITTTKASALVDLSNNNLNDISFIRLSGTLQMLNLDNNNISGLSGFPSSLTANVNINLSQNPLQCSVDLNDNWIILKLRNIIFTNDLECSFENSTNKYSVKKYGWMFESEKNVLDNINNAFLFQAYLNASNVKFSIEVSSKRLRIGWKYENNVFNNIYDYFLTSSQYLQGKELYSKTIEMKNNQNVEVVFKDDTSFANICLLANIPRSITFGIENANISFYCLKFSPSKVENSNIGYIIAIAILAFFLVIAVMGFAFYFYKTKKLQKQSSKGFMDNEKKRIVPNETDISPPTFDNDAYDPRVENQLRRNTARNLNESRISSNIYEITQNSNDNSFITNKDKTLRENITSNIYEVMDNSNDEINYHNQDMYLTMN